MQMLHILFFDESDEHGWMSNYATTPIFLNGKLWPTVEHYYQAMKFAGTAHEERIRCAPSPFLAKRLASSPDHAPRADWNDIKDRVMLDALRAKVTQHAALRALLLATGDADIVEHTEKDAYWADGGDGTGKNMLGVLFMRVRGELRG